MGISGLLACALGTLAAVQFVLLLWQSFARAKLARERDGFFARALAAEAEVTARDAALATERARSDENRDRLQDAFRGLAATALEGNARQFLDLAKTSLARDAASARADLEARQVAIDGALGPVREALERYEAGTRELEKERQRSYALVESELKRVVESGTKLAAETAALKNALKKPHVRGRWGEAQLKNCIELAGMSEFADVSFQDSSRDIDGARLVPDMTVRMPGGRVVVVDAKTPLEAFLGSMEADTDEGRGSELARHGRHLREHVKKLSTRAYADQVKGSADFTILFLPNESFLYAALETQPDIMDFALEKKVLIATPPTLIGLLKVIRFGWNEERLARNAEAISEAAGKLHKRLVDFVTAFEGIGKHLDRARAEYDIGSKRLHGHVLSQARKMEALGGRSAKDLPVNLVAEMSKDALLELGDDVPIVLPAPIGTSFIGPEA